MKKVFVACILFFSCTGRIDGADYIKLEKLVITPLRVTSYDASIPAHITVITQEDIKKTNAQSTIEVLKTVSGLTVRDYYGTGAKASVDLRGFGETAGMNTLVLLDGRRTNEIDLSGVDWTQIPLERIEKIEIIRGMGSVLYGDNAQGGVINIITKSGKHEPRGSFSIQGGSYGTHREILDLSGSFDRLSYAFDTSRVATAGYRENSDYRGTDVGGKLSYRMNDIYILSLDGHYHDANLGLPGAIRESQLATRNRRATMFPDNEIAEEDYYARLGVTGDWNDAGEFTSDFSFRTRRLKNDLTSSQHLSLRTLDTLGISPRYSLQKDILGKKNTMVTGIDYYRSQSTQDDYTYSGMSFFSGAKTRATDIDKDTFGSYLQDNLSLTENLDLLAGWRFERAQYTFYSVPQAGPWTEDMFWSNVVVDQRLRLDEEATNAGIKYRPWKPWAFFFNYAKGFRTPATDEYYSIWSTPPVNTRLLPQASKNYEIGSSLAFKDFSFDISAFQMKIKNELYYNPLTFTNENYEKTEHRGGEASARLAMTKLCDVTANYAFTQAFFIGGVYDHNEIPLIPKHRASLSIIIKPIKDFTIGVTGNYVGKRYFINDPAHAYPRLDDYKTIDLKLSYTYKNCDIFFGVNNLFAARYSEFGAISTVYAERGFYPSPERNFSGGVILKF